MTEPAPQIWEEVPEPDISHLVMEDDEPVDNLFSERQQALLSDALCASWEPERSFLTMTNVGLFFSLSEPPYVPDFLLSLDVQAPADVKIKKHRSYLIWEYGKRPDLVIEVVSNIDRHEERKVEGYARIGIPYYAIFDPERRLSERVLRTYELHGSRYVDLVAPRFPDLGLGLGFWEGEYRGVQDTWIRWCTPDGVFLPTALEKAAQAQSQAAQAQAQAAQAQARAEALEAKLKELGVDPDGL